MTKEANGLKVKAYFKSGEAWIWINASAVTLCLLMIVGIISLLASNGLAHFWPKAILQANYQTPNEQLVIVGEKYDSDSISRIRMQESGEPVPADAQFIERYSIKMGNKDVTGQDFKWVTAAFLKDITYPRELYRIERTEWGVFYGKLNKLSVNGVATSQPTIHSAFAKAVDRVSDLREQQEHLEKTVVGKINAKLEKLRLKEKRLQLNNRQMTTAERAAINSERTRLQTEFDAAMVKSTAMAALLNQDVAGFALADGSVVDMPLAKIIEQTQPNNMGFWGKLAQFFHNIGNFVSDNPRESNTEGGVFPAIFGTVVMVLLMTIFVTPLGVIAAIYMREYASQGRITQVVRIAVNNLAGIPSIVYGVFGLGFFIYVMGGSIDKLFYPESSPQPVFGTPGLMWASITLALLTLPVVIVATEEGLTRIPRALKEGSLALGATKAETLWRVILPMAAPSIMTGVILAIARAAGEVAPLMLVGVVKLAPNLPIDGNFPFVHMDQKFMHLGFHIYDVGFQSPNVEASRPLVYATAFLLVLLVVALNLTAIILRNKMREKFKSLEH